MRSSVARAPPRPLNGLTLFGLGLRMFLRHRTFIGPRMFLFTPRGTREAIRIIAQRFANEVGPVVGRYNNREIGCIFLHKFKYRQN